MAIKDTLLEGTFAATGVSAGVPLKGKANVLITGGSGVVEIQKSFDDGATWNVISKDSSGAAASYDTASVDLNGTVEEPEFGIKYRFECTAYTSGTITFRLSR